MSKSELIVGLDIGTTKICCVVGETSDDGTMNIVGVGESPSTGLRKGVVVNIEQTVQSIRKAVEEAERMANCEIRSVYAGIAGSHIKGTNSHGAIPLKDGKEVDARDIERVIEAAKAVAIPSGSEVIHILPQEYIVDDQLGISDPVGMSGYRLEAHVHIVTGAITSAQNIIRSCKRSNLEVSDIVLEALASSKAILTDEEREIGVAIVDLGGGTSDIAVLSLNGIVCKSSVKMAGNKMNAAIVRYVRSTYNVLIGDSTADRVKREIGTVWTEGQPEKTVEVKGRNLVTGLPQKITLSSYELEMPLRIEVERIITALQSVMEQTPPELVADIEKNGLLMTGGGAMLDGLDKLITSRVRIRAHLAENPIEAVAIGTGKSFEYLGKLYDGFVSYTNYSSR